MKWCERLSGSSSLIEFRWQITQHTPRLKKRERERMRRRAQEWTSWAGSPCRGQLGNFSKSPPSVAPNLKVTAALWPVIMELCSQINQPLAASNEDVRTPRFVGLEFLHSLKEIITFLFCFCFVFFFALLLMKILPFFSLKSNLSQKESNTAEKSFAQLTKMSQIRAQSVRNGPHRDFWCNWKAPKVWWGERWS